MRHGLDLAMLASGKDERTPGGIRRRQNGLMTGCVCGRQHAPTAARTLGSGVMSIGEGGTRSGTAAQYLGHGLPTIRSTGMSRRIWGRVVVLGSLVVTGLVGAAGLPRGAGVAEVEAAFPGRNGLIAFASNRGFQNPFGMEIYTI